MCREAHFLHLRPPSPGIGADHETDGHRVEPVMPWTLLTELTRQSDRARPGEPISSHPHQTLGLTSIEMRWIVVVIECGKSPGGHHITGAIWEVRSSPSRDPLKAQENSKSTWH